MKVVCCCTKCATKYTVDEIRLGRKAKCARCGESFVLGEAQPQQPRTKLSETAAVKAEAKKAPPKFHADPIVLKVLDVYSGQMPLEPDEKLINFVSVNADPGDVHSGLLLTTTRLLFFDQRQEVSTLFKNIRTVRLIDDSAVNSEATAGLTVFGHKKNGAVTCLQVNDNLYRLCAPRRYIRRLLNNLSGATATDPTMRPVCTENDILFIAESEKGITIEVPAEVALEFPDECARCGSRDTQENFHVRSYYIPYCRDDYRLDHGVGKRGSAVKVVKMKRNTVRLLFARGEYARNFIALNTISQCG